MLELIISLLTEHFLFFALHFDNKTVFPKPLSAREERECFERMASGDRSAKDKLIEHNLRLVAHIIKKYYSTAADQDDLISIGTFGLIKAVDTFSPEKGSRFATYASRCIENPILSLRTFLLQISFSSASEMPDVTPFASFGMVFTCSKSIWMIQRHYQRNPVALRQPSSITKCLLPPDRSPNRIKMHLSISG